MLLWIAVRVRFRFGSARMKLCKLSCKICSSLGIIIVLITLVNCALEVHKCARSLDALMCWLVQMQPGFNVRKEPVTYPPDDLMTFCYCYSASIQYFHCDPYHLQTNHRAPSTSTWKKKWLFYLIPVLTLSMKYVILGKEMKLIVEDSISFGLPADLVVLDTNITGHIDHLCYV